MAHYGEGVFCGMRNFEKVYFADRS